MRPHTRPAEADASSSPLCFGESLVPAPSAASRVDPTLTSTQDWDALDDRQRRLQLEAMDPDAVRSLAASMPTIEQAKGILMGCFGVDATTAFAILCRISSTKNVKLRDLAAIVVQAVSAPAMGRGTGW